MNIDAKITRKLNPATYKKDYKLYTMIEWDLFQECKVGSVYKNQLMVYIMLLK